MPTCKDCRKDYVEVPAHHIDRFIARMAEHAARGESGSKIDLICLLRDRDGSSLFDAKKAAETMIDAATWAATDRANRT